MPDRRDFLKSSLLAAAAASFSRSAAAALPPASTIRLGLIVPGGNDPLSALQKVRSFDLPTAQLGLEDFSPAMVEKTRQAIQQTGIEVTAINCSGPGNLIYDFYQGPETIGVVPVKFRAARVQQLKAASDFARKVGVHAVHTHCGFIPENPNDPNYEGTVKALKEVISHVRENGQNFLFETGQETPVTLLRAIRDVGLDNQRVNLDTANLILYGKGNPVDALDVIGKYVGGLHAKDGLFPTDPAKLGEEVAIGQGKANFPEIVRKLKALNYSGPITIEREIEGPQQGEDIRQSKIYLEGLIG
ncbi:MAG: sugar phosphate isomerase/epimerase [Acidobacteria bacterium]|nr:sugar phosphate isomerase/epimerase [Acidobacteriota bacterium]